MKREIKFRGKTPYGHWVFGNLIIDAFGHHQIVTHKLGPKNRSQSIDYYEVIPETVGQYIGLKDNNGVEVYEGDNVLFTWFSYGEYELESHYEGSVEFINGSFMFCCQHGNYPFSELEFDSESDLEVIGNIHEKGG